MHAEVAAFKVHLVRKVRRLAIAVYRLLKHSGSDAASMLMAGSRTPRFTADMKLARGVASKLRCCKVGLNQLSGRRGAASRCWTYSNHSPKIAVIRTHVARKPRPAKEDGVEEGVHPSPKVLRDQMSRRPDVPEVLQCVCDNRDFVFGVSLLVVM